MDHLARECPVKTVVKAILADIPEAANWQEERISLVICFVYFEAKLSLQSLGNILRATLWAKAAALLTTSQRRSPPTSASSQRGLRLFSEEVPQHHNWPKQPFC
jgi:hypothetical protein